MAQPPIDKPRVRNSQSNFLFHRRCAGTNSGPCVVDLIQGVARLRHLPARRSHQIKIALLGGEKKAMPNASAR